MTTPWVKGHLKTSLGPYELRLRSDGQYDVKGEYGIQVGSSSYVEAEFCLDPQCEYNQGGPIGIHQCAILQYQSQYLEKVYPGEDYQRWLLKGQPKEQRQESDPVELQFVCFCPYCGLDLRKDLKWRILGGPTFNALLDTAQEECQRLSCLSCKVKLKCEYKVHESVWAKTQLGVQSDDRLCLQCLEDIIGRPLSPMDFDLDLPVNAGVLAYFGPMFWQRLQDVGTILVEGWHFDESEIEHQIQSHAHELPIVTRKLGDILQRALSVVSPTEDNDIVFDRITEDTDVQG